MPDLPRAHDKGPNPPRNLSAKEQQEMRKRLTRMIDLPCGHGGEFETTCTLCGTTSYDPYRRVLRVVVGLMPVNQMAAVHDYILVRHLQSDFTTPDNKVVYRVDSDALQNLERFVAEQFPKEGDES